MQDYIYNKSKLDGKYHEVHATKCIHLPRIENQVSLGWHSDCKSAISEAERETGDHDFDGCAFCSLDCHKG